MVTHVKCRKIISISLVLLLLEAISILNFPVQVRAITTTFDAAADSYMDETLATMNYGGSTELRVQSLSMQNQRTLLRFDMSSIPAGQTISSAALKLYVNMNLLAAERTYGVYRLTQTDWVEGSVTWSSRDGTSNWTTPGGTFTTDNMATATVPTGNGIWVTWTVTDQISYAYANSVNANFLVMDTAEGMVSAQMEVFNSRETVDSNLRPKLEVSYNQAPNTPTLNFPADGATGVSTTPSLIFNYSDPNADNCAKFDIKVDNNADFSSPEVNVVDYTTGGPWASGSAITYPVGTALSGGTRYYWQVRVNDGIAWSNWSDGSWDFTTAATTGSTSIEIRDQNYLTAIVTVTFPEASPGSSVFAPINSQGQTQTFGGAGSAKPVVTLVNTADISYIIWYNISAFSNNVVSDEYYLINSNGAACTGAGAIGSGVVFGSNQSTGITIGKTTDGAAAQKDLYLKVTLGNVALKSGTSTLTILGEIP
jgi:hypothetical protein